MSSEARYSSPGSGLVLVRCTSCKRPLPVKLMLTPGAVVSIRCRHCREATVKVGQQPPHWA